MSDTPRTDALFESLHLPYNNDIPVEITIHAMNLERELAATKRELAQARAECGIAHDQRRDEAHRANNAESDLELSELSVATLKNRAEVAESRVRELEVELSQSFELAESQLYAEKLAGNIVKEEFWKGELSALHRIRKAIQGKADK